MAFVNKLVKNWGFQLVPIDADPKQIKEASNAAVEIQEKLDVIITGLGESFLKSTAEAGISIEDMRNLAIQKLLEYSSDKNTIVHNHYLAARAGLDILCDMVKAAQVAIALSQQNKTLRAELEKLRAEAIAKPTGQ